MPERWRGLLDWLARHLGGGPSLPVDPDAPPFAVRYHQVFESLSLEELQADPEPLSAADLEGGLFDVRQRNHHVLGLYTEHGVRTAFERYGFFDLLRERGLDPVAVGDLSDPDEHRLRIYDAQEDPSRLLIELAVGRRGFTLPDGAACELLLINWLLMQDPRASFPAGQPALPDQAHPGLGLFLHFGYLLRLTAVRIGCDGLLNHPAHFHNAVLYGKFMHFVDPRVEGCLLALQRDLAEVPLAEATLAVDAGEVVDASGQPLTWEPAAQVLPITARARAWFESPDYAEAVAMVRERARYRRR